MSEVKFEVVHSDENGMVLRFSAEGEPDVDWGCRLPFEGESIVDVARQYDPRPYWAELKRPKIVPAVGATGTI